MLDRASPYPASRQITVGTLHLWDEEQHQDASIYWETSTSETGKFSHMIILKGNQRSLFR